jgi:VanZ family protein
MIRILKYWLPLVLWMAVIFCMSTDAGSTAHSSRILGSVLRWLHADISQEAINTVHLCMRKGAHLSEYALLSILLLRALWALKRWQMRKFQYALVALLLAAGYAATDEFHQAFIPGRESCLRDVLIDTCGALVGLGFVGVGLKVREWWRRRQALKAPHSMSANREQVVGSIEVDRTEKSARR